MALRTTVSGIGEAPYSTCCRLDRSKSPTCGWFTTMLTMVGTSRAVVTLWSCIARIVATGSKAGMTIDLPPPS